MNNMMVSNILGWLTPDIPFTLLSHNSFNNLESVPLPFKCVACVCTCPEPMFLDCSQKHR